MRTITVTFDNGDSITTDINGTDQEINDYYIGQTFNLGQGCDDLLTTALTVEFLEVK